MKFAQYIKEIGRGAKGARSLGRPAAAELFGAMLDGEVGELELGAILIALRVKSESLEELLGFDDALRARLPALPAPEGPRCVVLPTYNGARRQPNLMPLVALALARRGVPVLIQGRHDFDSRVSPFALLAELGIRPEASPAAAALRLAGERLACIELEQLSPGLARLLATRPRLGVRSSAHTMAKLLDPLPQRSVRVVAVTHPEYLERMDEFLRACTAHALLMRGTEGEIYANPRRRPRMLAYSGPGGARVIEGETGGAPPLADLPEGVSPGDNARTIERMLRGDLPVPAPIEQQVELLATLAHA